MKQNQYTNYTPLHSRFWAAIWLCQLRSNLSSMTEAIHHWILWKILLSELWILAYPFSNCNTALLKNVMPITFGFRLWRCFDTIRSYKITSQAPCHLRAARSWNCGGKALWIWYLASIWIQYFPLGYQFCFLFMLPHQHVSSQVFIRQMPPQVSIKLALSQCLGSTKHPTDGCLSIKCFP